MDTRVSVNCERRHTGNRACQTMACGGCVGWVCSICVCVCGESRPGAQAVGQSRSTCVPCPGVRTERTGWQGVVYYTCVPNPRATRVCGIDFILFSSYFFSVVDVVLRPWVDFTLWPQSLFVFCNRQKKNHITTDFKLFCTHSKTQQNKSRRKYLYNSRILRPNQSRHVQVQVQTRARALD